MTQVIKTFDEYRQAWKKSVDDPEGFWAEQAESFVWQKKWDKVLEWNFKEPDIKWFINGKLNITEIVLDRHIAERGDQVAILWEPNDPNGEVQRYTYRELYHEVCKTANGLKIKRNWKRRPRLSFICQWFLNWLSVCWHVHVSVQFIPSYLRDFQPRLLRIESNDATCKMMICSDFNHRGSKKYSGQKSS